MHRWSWPTWRSFVVALCTATILHTPLFATRLFDFLSLMLSAQQAEITDLDGEAIIPIDLDLLPPGAAPPPEPAPTGDPASVLPEPSAAAIKPRRLVADAGADDAGGADAAEDAPSDAAPDGSAEGPADAGPDGAFGSDDPDAGDAGNVAVVTPADAGADAEPPKVAKAAPTLKEPLSVAGDPSRIAGKEPNVQVLISGDRLREHELGAWFGRILTAIPEWRTFFEGTTIDPIRDLDHLLIAGPQLRDSRKAVAVMDYNVQEADIRKAIDAIIARSKPKGAWLTDTPVPAARATAHRGERIFALVPARRLLVVLPAEAKNQLAGLKSMKAFSKSSASGIAISMVTPSRAFRGLPIEIPESLKWMRLNVIPNKDGSAEVQIEALDESPELAVEHAGKLSDTIERFRHIDYVIGKMEIIGRADFVAEGALIRATAQVSKKQLSYIMSFVDQKILPKQGAEGAKFKEPK
jgi:hypothetical protein